jgi:outer membrane protein TolC
MDSLPNTTEQMKKAMTKKRSRYLLFLICISVPVISMAGDTTHHVLTKDDFINIVKRYHPIARQADIQVERAKANIMQSRGAFDPEIATTLDRKTFDGKLYYSYFKPELTIPTWYGIDVKAGVEEIVGSRVSSESTLGQTSYIGIKVPANQLLFDKRRATLRQAQALQQQTAEERKLAVNNLLYEGLAAYWNWVEKYCSYKMITSAVAVGEERLRFVKLEFEQGLRPAIDTIEAITQLQTFYFQESSMLLAFRNAGMELSNYLWLENNLPVEWTDLILPDTTDFDKAANDIPELDALLAAVEEHPKLRSLNYKMDVLAIEKTLKAQSLIPKLSLSGNILSKGYKYPHEVSLSMLENNHKVGVSFVMPLFLRDARGGYNAAKLKIAETDLERNNTRLQIENKTRSYYNELLAVRQQLNIMTSTNVNFIKLYQGEWQKFEIGESSLFLLNARQSKVLETSQKLIELRAKLQKAYVSLLWSSGTLY